MNEQQSVSATPAPPVAPPPAPYDAPPVPVQDAPANPGAVSAPAQPAAPAAPPAVEPDYRAMYENARRENEILRHNAQIAQSAPVQGVTGGGVPAEPVDDFIRGFDSDVW